jgi:hypothetical protein
MADNTLDKERRQVDLSRGVQKVTKPPPPGRGTPHAESQLLLAQILWAPASEWRESTVRLFCELPRHARLGTEPTCRKISRYRRTGKLARYEFWCELSSPCTDPKKAGAFWLPWNAVQNLEGCRAFLQEKRFLMAEHIFEYSGGESAYETESAEDDEGRKYVRHRKIAGTEHELTKRRRAVPMRVRSAIPTQRPLPTPV